MRLALTMGDPGGIGPEITLKALAAVREQVLDGQLRIMIVGCRASFARAAGTFAEGQEILEWLTEGSKGASLVDVGDHQDTEPCPVGEPSAKAGELAYRSIARAVELAMDGQVDGIVTGPVSKEAINLAGYQFSGHTELLAQLSGGSDPVMMLAHDHLRVSHVSTHVALSKVPERMTPARIGHVTKLTWQTLRRLGIDDPHIAIAALNPHAGEGGVLGKEDAEITGPVVGELRGCGLRVDGPVPGDTVFVKLRARQYDAVVAMYHDQGHIPVKLLGFTVNEATGAWEGLSGVNITLGLPIIRTSVDHGTAFDIAGLGTANAMSFVEAIDYAVLLCRPDARNAQVGAKAGHGG